MGGDYFPVDSGGIRPRKTVMESRLAYDQCLSNGSVWVGKA